MKISPIFNNFSYYTNKYTRNKNASDINPSANMQNTISAYYPVFFSGGKSMNLAETKTALDQIPDAYPPDIQERIENTLANNNPNNKTLIDIHKDKYALLTECESLNEAKSLYPEFSNVLSDNQVIYKEDSFIDEVKKNKVKGFDPDIDVALQILQLYWGEGFSLTTLREDYADKNIGYTFQKLGIPRVNSVYGQYLKLSDKDYNERYTRTISERAAEIERKRVEKQEGVFVPRGAMSDEQKAKISDSLKKYYAQNPDRLQEMSERQIKYYIENPEDKQRLTQVMLRAWNYKEAASIKKKLSKFINKTTITEQDIEEGMNPKSPTAKAFRDFWKKNGWAKKIFSDCMQKSWKRQDELTDLDLIYEPLYQIAITPSLFKNDIAEYAKNRMPDIIKYIDYIMMDPRDSERHNGAIQLQTDKVKEAFKIGSEYYNTNEKASEEAANVYLAASISALLNLHSLNKKTNGKVCPQLDALIKKFQEDINGKSMARDICNIFISLISFCLSYDDNVSVKELEKCLEKTAIEYRQFTQKHQGQEFFKQYSSGMQRILGLERASE